MAITFGTGSKLANFYALKTIHTEFSGCVVFERTTVGFLVSSFFLGIIATNIIEKRQALRQDSYRISFEVETEDIRIA